MGHLRKLVATSAVAALALGTSCGNKVNAQNQEACEIARSYYEDLGVDRFIASGTFDRLEALALGRDGKAISDSKIRTGVFFIGFALGNGDVDGVKAGLGKLARRCEQLRLG
jgi:hypothetical protein